MHASDIHVPPGAQQISPCRRSPVDVLRSVMHDLGEPVRLRCVLGGLIFILLLGASSAAHADLTVFGGVASSPSRATVGVAAGRCIRPPLRRDGSERRTVACYELELGQVFRNDARNPAVTTFGGNFLVRFPSSIPRTMFHVIVGFGVYDELGSNTQTGLGGNRNLGGGIHRAIAGPLSLRLEYRVLFLSDSEGAEPRASRIHRLATGLSVGF